MNRPLLTDAELAEIRTQLARRDPNVGGGYTWTTIEALLDTIDALRSQSPMPSAEPDTPPTLSQMLDVLNEAADIEKHDAVSNYDNFEEAMRWLAGALGGMMAARDDSRRLEELYCVLMEHENPEDILVNATARMGEELIDAARRFVDTTITPWAEQRNDRVPSPGVRPMTDTLRIKRLSTGAWHVRGNGPCEWAQFASWPPSDADLVTGVFPEASQKFRDQIATIIRDGEAR
jgi:hypothetical protein